MAAGYDGSIRINTKIDQMGAEKGISRLTGSLKRFASAVGVAFGVAQVVSFGKAAVDAASNLTNAFTGLRSIAEGTGQSFSQAQAFLQQYISDGLVPATNAAQAYKNLLARGYDTKQIQDTLNRLKDSAAFSRQASLTMGEAVQTATEGLKNENSILVDNAGVTKNVSVMWADYAKKIGVGVQSLTKAQKIQAEYQGIMQETRWQVGDAAKLTSTYSGEVSRLAFNFNNLKVALGNAIIPVMRSVLPYISNIVTGLTSIADRLAVITQGMFGAVTSADLSSATNSANDLTDSLTDAGKAATSTAGKLAGFDEIKTLSTGDSAGTSSSSGGSGASSGSASTLSGSGTELSDSAKQQVDIITAAVSAGLLALGALLAFTGANIPLGIGLMVIGAAGLAAEVAINWSSIKDALQGPIGAVTGIVGTAFLALGAILAFTGANIPLGIGLMAVGALGVGATIAANWNSMKDTLTGPLRNVNLAVAGALLGLGAALAFSGINIPLGIALMAGGAATLAPVVAANWSSIVEALRGPVGWVTAIMGGALIALGAILLFSGVGIPLGLGLILAGGISLGTAIAANWDVIPGILGGIGQKIKDIFWSVVSVVGDLFSKLWAGIKSGFIDFVNMLVDGINMLINGFLAPVNLLISGWNNSIGNVAGKIPTINISIPKVPKLAQGAVIPPNRQFLAVLGDQKSGKNIEAPADLIKQMVMEAMSALGVGGGQGDTYVYIGNEQLDGRIVRVVRSEAIRSNGRAVPV